MPKLKPQEFLYLYSMGKKFRITAIFTSDAEANAYMEKNNDEGVIACASGFVFIANIRDRGEA